MGNVSNNIASLHVFYSIGNSNLTLHTKDFRTAAGTTMAHTATLNVSKAMAMAGAQLLSNPKLAEASKDDFKKYTLDS
jgi:hypothetical protein